MPLVDPDLTVEAIHHPLALGSDGCDGKETAL
jgi:hypothetical protein